MSLVIICGATATGKSDLAISVAKEINAEIVNADSMQLYKGMDIGTAKLSLIEREGIKHHLLVETSWAMLSKLSAARISSSGALLLMNGINSARSRL